MPFHHLLPVSLDPRELPSFSLGSVRARALRKEISKMLLKGALEPVDQPSLEFYSRLFLVEKVARGWWPVIDLLALNGFVTLTKFQMETVASMLGSIWKGYWMFSIDLKDAYFQIPVHPESRPFRNRHTGGACVYSVTWMIGWSLRCHGPFCCSIGIWFSSCAGIWESLSTGGSLTSSRPLVPSI